MRRGTMLARDSELRRLWWAVASNDKTLGQRGPEIAAAMAGPGDMVSANTNYTSIVITTGGGAGLRVFFCAI